MELDATVLAVLADMNTNLFYVARTWSRRAIPPSESTIARLHDFANARRATQSWPFSLGSRLVTLPNGFIVRPSLIARNPYQPTVSVLLGESQQDVILELNLGITPFVETLFVLMGALILATSLVLSLVGRAGSSGGAGVLWVLVIAFIALPLALGYLARRWAILCGESLLEQLSSQGVIEVDGSLAMRTAR